MCERYEIRDPLSVKFISNEHNICVLRVNELQCIYFVGPIMIYVGRKTSFFAFQWFNRST